MKPSKIIVPWQIDSQVIFHFSARLYLFSLRDVTEGKYRKWKILLSLEHFYHQFDNTVDCCFIGTGSYYSQNNRLRLRKRSSSYSSLMRGMNIWSSTTYRWWTVGDANVRQMIIHDGRAEGKNDTENVKSWRLYSPSDAYCSVGLINDEGALKNFCCQRSNIRMDWSVVVIDEKRCYFALCSASLIEWVMIMRHSSLVVKCWPLKVEIKLHAGIWSPLALRHRLLQELKDFANPANNLLCERRWWTNDCKVWRDMCLIRSILGIDRQAIGLPSLLLRWFARQANRSLSK